MKAVQVKEFMRDCTTAMIPASTRLRHAAETLVVNNVSVLVAINSDATIAGLVSETAIIRQLMSTPDRNQSIDSILSRHIESVRAEADLNSVLHLFRSSCHAVIPVLGRNDAVIGLLHRCDVVRMLLENTSTDAAHTDTDSLKPHFSDQRPRPRKASNDAASADNDGDAERDISSFDS